MNNKATINIPKDKGLDNTINLLKDGYLFISNRMNLYDTDIFETHIMGQKAICITGEDASKIFYDPDLFQRKGAAPKRVQKTLFGKNAIQSKDGICHIKRKSLFMEILSKEEVEKLSQLVKKELINSIYEWEQKGEVVLFKELSEIICYIVCNWSGISINKAESKYRTKDFVNMIYSFGSIGPRYKKGKKARKESEIWIENIVKEVRSKKLEVDKSTPLYKISFYKDIDNKLLDDKMAAIEIINTIRPIIAVSTYIVFAVLALYTHPLCKEKLIKNEKNYYENFVQEVRRFYPFTPFVGARVKKNFSWNEYEFKKGTLVLLDVYGINHDPRIWDDSEIFRPERFENKEKNLFDFIPQGGGNPAITHRCPGEYVVINITETVLDFLLNYIDFDVKKQDLSYNLNKIPTIPRSGFIISNIKSKS